MSLKILHTSDWHLGKKLFRLDRLPEQIEFLNWLIEILNNQKINHLIIAGDIFDVPQPPHRALKVFYDFLAKIVSSTKAQAWIIGGNHDSGTLLEAPDALLDSGRIHVFGNLRDNPLEHWAKLTFPDADKHLDLCLLPYFRHHELAPWKNSWEVEMSEGWPERLIQCFLDTPPETKSVGKIFSGHHLFGMFEAAGSEQALALSGLESIPLDWLKAFDYAALGHIHKPQVLKKNKPLVWYCGSPIPMRFSESAPKQVNLLKWEESGSFNCEILNLPIWRELIRIKATEFNWEELLEGISLNHTFAPAVELELHLNSPVPGLTEIIREKFLKRGIEFLTLLPVFAQKEDEEPDRDWTELLKLGPLELFESFYLSKYPEETEIPTDLKDDVKRLMEEARHAPPST